MQLQGRRSALLVNPPTGSYIREDRCQWPVKGLAATVLRPPLDLLYIAAVLEDEGVSVTLRDYPADGGDWATFESDVRAAEPEMLVVSTTSLTIDNDVRAAILAKALVPGCVTIAKGAHITVKGRDVLAGCPDLDLGLRGEAEVTLRHALRHPRSEWGSVFVREGGTVVATEDLPLLDDLDSLPFPARHLVDNSRYVRPDTRKPQTTLQTNRGCPAHCVYCLAPTVSGYRIRSRSAANIVDEIELCQERWGIRDFFFRADTFTWDKGWCLSVCDEIRRRGLRISWVANSRVDTIDEERLDAMKAAGLWLLSFGVESGSDEILRRMRKGATAEQARRAVRLCRAAGIKAYTFFVVGTPWETRETFRQTIDFAAGLGSDYAEFSFAVPFPGTELYEEAERAGLLHGTTLAGFTNDLPVTPTFALGREELVSLRKTALRRYYLSPSYIARTLWSARSPRVMKNYASMGFTKLRDAIQAPRPTAPDTAPAGPLRGGAAEA